MNRAPEIDISVPLAAVRAFSRDGQVYRSYAHAIAARPGLVLLVPIERVHGDLSDLVDGCPVPWEEVLAIIEEPSRNARPLPEWCTSVLGLPILYLARTHWDVDELPPPHPSSRIARLVHPSGIRLAAVIGASERWFTN